MTDDEKTDESTEVEQQDDEREHPEDAPDTLDGDQLDPVPDA